MADSSVALTLGVVDTARVQGSARVVVVVASAGLGWVSAAGAEPEASAEGTAASWYLPAGFSMGASLDSAHRIDPYFGAEVSLARLDEHWFWYGAYADSTYDFGSEAVLSSVGLEMGYRVVGVDAGYLARWDETGDVRHGLSLRPVLSTGLVSLVFRLGVLADPVEVFGQVGFLVKYPLELSD